VGHQGARLLEGASDVDDIHDEEARNKSVVAPGTQNGGTHTLRFAVLRIVSDREDERTTPAGLVTLSPCSLPTNSLRIPPAGPALRESVRHGREAESEMRGRIEAAPGCEQDAVIEGRKAVLKEIAESAQTLRDYLTEAARTLLAESRFLDVLPGFVLDNERVPLIQERLAVNAAGVS
jgi:hypothetical protein